MRSQSSVAPNPSIPRSPIPPPPPATPPSPPATTCFKNSKSVNSIVRDACFFLRLHILKGSLDLMDSAEVIGAQKDRVRVKRKTLEAVLQQCHMALQQLASGYDDDDDDSDTVDGEQEVSLDSAETSAPTNYDTDITEFYGLLKSGVECEDFVKKLENAKASLPRNIAEENSSWDIVNENDLWDGGNVESDPEDYVLVGQEDIMDGIASFMAAYLLSLKQTKDLSPNQLQAALSKTFSVKKRKGKLRKAWDGSKVIYNVASWGATAIGIYQNPALFRVASTAFWTSCQVISKLF